MCDCVSVVGLDSKVLGNNGPVSPRMDVPQPLDFVSDFRFSIAYHFPRPAEEQKKSFPVTFVFSYSFLVENVN